MATDDVKIVISAEDKASGILNDVGKSAGSLGGIFGGLATAAGVAAVAGIGALTAEAYRSVLAFDESNKVTNQMETVLKSTHNAAGLFIEDLTDQAKALQNLTTYNDEAVMGAQNLLLTFTQVKGPVFQQATETILDMSTALGQDLKSSSIQVGKALNDPINGINALRRVGVSFTDDQKQMIATMVESGNVMGAQQVILKELATEFGGSAAAAADTFSGRMQQLKNHLNDLEEIFGKVIVTAITPFIKQLGDWAASEDVQNKFTAITTKAGEMLAQFLQVIGTVIDLGGKIFKFGQDLMNQFKPTLDLIILVFQTQLTPAFKELWDTIETQLWPAVEKLWDTLQPFKPLILEFTKVIGALIVGAILVLIEALVKVAEIVVNVLTVITQLSTFISKVALAVWKDLEDKITSVYNAFKRLYDIAIQVKNAIASVGSIGAKAVSSVFGGGRAGGGPVSGGTSYLVGENGPEFFTPSSGGTITPNSAIGGKNIYINVTGSFLSQDAAEKMANMMFDKLKFEMRV